MDAAAGDPLSVEIKTVAQLLDELITCALRIWHLVDRVNAGDSTPGTAQTVQALNNRRHELMRAIDRRLGQQDIGPKVFSND